MKKIILTLLSLSIIGSASTVAAQDFNIAAKHAIAVEAKMQPSQLKLLQSQS